MSDGSDTSLQLRDRAIVTVRYLLSVKLVKPAIKLLIELNIEDGLKSNLPGHISHWWFVA